jgi:glutathione synthase/RimK-type ligase-like ATP-grasp enzyme
MSPFEAAAKLRQGDVSVGRFDVLATLDGVEPGLEVLDELGKRGIRVINGGTSLLNTHDKLRTTRLLTAAQLPHPPTAHVVSVEQAQRGWACPS